MEAEVARLSKRFGRPRRFDHVFDDPDFGPLNRGRQAEVAMAIRRLNGCFLLQAKKNYPPDTYRLPTGGIKRGEGIEHALLREVKEETGLEVEIARFTAVLNYRAAKGGRLFSSYLFILDERSGELGALDPSEGISDWLEADAQRLADAAERLRSCRGGWQNWGTFRALAIDALVPAVATATTNRGHPI